jgi:hypothetical protein
MTKFDNKFVPVAPKTYTVSELRDTQQPVKKSGLSAAARSKVVNRSGGNYLSENQGGYGPCIVCDSNETITVEFYLGCPSCSNSEPSYWHHNKSGCENSRMLITNRGFLSCGGCGTGYNMSNWRFSCSNHPGEYRSMSEDC